MKAIIKGKKDEELGGEIKSPPSKSYTHRAILAASLSKEGSRIEDPLISKDTRATLKGCQALGATIKEKDGLILVNGFGKKPKIPEDVLDLKNSGTSLRFLISVSSLLKDGYAVLTGDSSLRSRPNDPLIEAIERLGARAFSTKGNGTAPIVVSGEMEGGTLEIKGNLSSQFISSLLISAPCGRKDSHIKVKPPIKSKPYLDMTVNVLSEFGINISKSSNIFDIEGNQKYNSTCIKVPGDFSSAANILALGALSKDSIKVKNLKSGNQADEIILNLLEKFGAEVHQSEDEVKINGHELEGIKINASNFPDLVPILAVVGALSRGRTEIIGVPHARLKECDRIKAMATELRKMGADIKEKGDGLIIKSRKLKGAELDGQKDHRVIMALSIASVFAEGKSIIHGAENIDVSFPNFFDILEEVGVDLTYSTT